MNSYVFISKIELIVYADEEIETQNELGSRVRKYVGFTAHSGDIKKQIFQTMMSFNIF